MFFERMYVCMWVRMSVSLARATALTVYWILAYEVSFDSSWSVILCRRFVPLRDRAASLPSSFGVKGFIQLRTLQKKRNRPSSGLGPAWCVKALILERPVVDLCNGIQ